MTDRADRRTVRVGSRGLALAGVEGEHPIVSAEVHSWRLDPDRWAEVLDAVVSLGFRTIATYVPWSAHELADGRFDWTGPRDVVRFLRMAEERGLKAIVRVGPNGAAEIPDSGWPRRVLDDGRCQARRPGGLPYLLATATSHCFPPSYASPVVLEEVGRWYDEVVSVLAPLQHPDGPVIACQVDNELGYHFQGNAFALDHHPASVAGFRAHLRARYGSIDALNDAYGGTGHRSFDEVPAPTDGSDEPEAWRLDWVSWKEEHLRQVLATLSSMLRERGMDRVVFVHNDYPRLTSPHDLGALEASGAVDLASADVYAGKEGQRFVRDVVRRLAGSSRLPFLAELGAGWLTLPWLLPSAIPVGGEPAVALRAFASGLRAANVYMLVERDRWYGSPVARDGELRPGAELWRRLLALLDELGWWELERVAPVLVVEDREEAARVAARDTMADVVPCFDQILPLDQRLTSLPHPDTDRLRALDATVAAALAAAGVDADTASSAALPALDRYETVVVPTLGNLGADAWGALVGAASAGVDVVVCGRAPTAADPDAVLPPRVHVLAEPDAGSLAGLLPPPPYRCADPAVDIHVWRGVDHEVVFAFNVSPVAVSTTIEWDGHRVLRGRWEGIDAGGEGGGDVVLGPWAAEVFLAWSGAGGARP